MRLLLARIDEFTVLPRLFTWKNKLQTAMSVILIFWREKKCKFATILEKIMYNTWNWLHIFSRKCPLKGMNISFSLSYGLNVRIFI